MRTTLKTVFLIMIAIVFPAWSQYDTGTILGTVTDPSGGVIPHEGLGCRDHHQ